MRGLLCLFFIQTLLFFTICAITPYRRDERKILLADKIKQKNNVYNSRVGYYNYGVDDVKNV